MLLMKRRLIILFIIVVFFSCSYVFIKLIVRYFVKALLNRTFIGSTVTIGDCSVNLLQGVSLSNIEIVKKPDYELIIKYLSIKYSFGSLINRSISRVSLGNVKIYVNLPKVNPEKLKAYYRLSSHPPLFLINSLELSGFDLDINLKDLKLNGNISLGMDMKHQLIDSCRVHIGLLRSGGMELRNISLEQPHYSSSCVLRADTLKFDKLHVKNMSGYVLLKDNSLFIDSLSADILGGNLRAKLGVVLNKGLNYFMNLEFKRLDLDILTNEFNLRQKADMSGKLDGVVLLKGSLKHVEILDGDFSALAPGGNINIKDERFLANIADSSGQPKDIIMESLKNYRYNNGIMKLSFDKEIVMLNVGLDGNAGKRNFNIFLHDVIR